MVKYKYIINNHFESLNENQLDEAINSYYNGEKINDILKRYELKINPSMFIRYFPKVYSEDLCEFCEEKLIGIFQSRNYLSEDSNRIIFECPTCHHNPSNVRCSCDSCKKIKKDLEKEWAIKIFNKLIEPYKVFENHPVEFNSIDPFSKVMLSILLKTNFDVANNEYIPAANYKRNVFPRNYILSNVIENLVKEGVLYPTYLSLPHNFRNESKLDFLNVAYQLNVKYNEKSLNDIYIDFIILESNDFKNDYDFVKGMWSFIFVEEVMAYMKYRLNEVKMYCTLTDNTHLRLMTYIDKVSISEMFSFIYYSVKSMVYYKAQGHYNSQNCESYLLNGIDRCYMRSVNHEFEKQHFSRAKSCEESLLYETFFNRILGIGRLGLDMCMQDYLDDNF